MRECLPIGTWVRFPDGECYEITGPPIGEGGGSLVYPAVRKRYVREGEYSSGKGLYALKECFPVSAGYVFARTKSGEIVPEPVSEKSLSYLHAVQAMQMEEGQTTGEIYETGFRLTPIVNGSGRVDLSFDGGKTFTSVRNTVTVMESLAEKGRSLKSYLSERRHLSAAQSFRVIEQVLFALREVHQAGYLHLDIQDGNVFLKGSLNDNSHIATLIDFGAARKMEADGRSAPIEDRAIFSTAGFSAPEMIRKNDGTLRLGPEADLYSTGYLLLLLLTGERKKPHRLYAVRNGCYLTNFDFRKIKCPAHLRGQMQKILAGALALEPEDRYHSCEEMLRDVADFAAALQPYRSDLSQVAYDAFICYKHGPVDSAAAKKLQEYLEHFRTPRSEKKIKRVFVDEGELSSCGDFGRQIEDALKQAGWLIVVCSPDTKESRWVGEEIRTFLKYHDRSRVLAVITGGDPEESIPEELGGNREVLAADARGKNLKEVLKKLKKDALLRIAAPILGVTYETLKQRHRIYRLRRTAAASCVMLGAMAVFTLYTLYQSARIQEQYQKARENQARYLSSMSLELLAEGDREKALLTALAVGPEKDSDGAVVPEQMYALNSALAVYASSMSGTYAPKYVGEAENAVWGALSSDGRYYYAVDDAGNGSVLSGEDGKLLWRFDSADLETALPESSGYEYEGFAGGDIRSIVPLEDGRAAVCMYGCIAVVDAASRKVAGVFPAEGILSEPFAQNGDLLAYEGNGSCLYIYSLDTGRQEAYVDFNLTGGSGEADYVIESLSFNPDGTALAVGLSYQALPEGAGTGADGEPSYMGLAVYDLETGDITAVSEKQTERVLFADDSRIAAVHFDVLQGQAEYMWGVSTCSYYTALYGAGIPEPLYQGGRMTSLYTSSTGLTTAELTFGGGSVRALAAWIRGNLYVVDLDTGSVLAEMLYSSDITGTAVYGKSGFYVGLADGTVQTLDLDPVIFRTQILKLSGTANQFTYNPATEGIILHCGGRLVFCDGSTDSGMQDLYAVGESDDTLSGNIYYTEIEGQTYRYLYTDTQLAVFLANEEGYLYTYEAEEGSKITNVGLGGSGDSLYAAFLETAEDGDVYFVKEDVYTGENQIRENVTGYETLDFNAYSPIVYSGRMDALFVKRDYGVVRFDISGTSMIPDDRAILAREMVNDMALTGDGKYLALEVRDTDTGSRRVYAYGLEEGTLEELQIDVDFSGDRVSGFITAGTASSRVCFYDGGDTFAVVDCGTGETAAKIPAEAGKDYELAFFDQDQYIIFSTGNAVYLYSLEDGTAAYRYETDFSSSALKVVTDGSSRYFALKDNSVTEDLLSGTGIVYETLYIFSVDEDHKFYRFADVDCGYASFSGQEILTCRGNVFAFTTFYDYARLKEKALEILDGRTLTEEERLEYFISAEE